MGVMEGMKELLNYFVSSKEEVLSLLIEHIELTVLALLAAILIGVPLGILISYIRPASKPVLAFANIVQAVPSLSLIHICIYQWIPYRHPCNSGRVAIVTKFSDRSCKMCIRDSHLDTVHWLPGWEEKAEEQERSEVRAFMDRNASWVIDGKMCIRDR